MGNLSDQNFDANDVEPNGTFDVIPRGDYECIIIDSMWKDTSKGNGRYLALELQITKGEYSNRVLWCNLNLDNPSAKAMEIARGTLSAICRAVGVLTPEDSSDLHLKPLVAVVRVKKDPKYGDKNEVKGFKPIEKAKPAKIVDTPPPTREEMKKAEPAKATGRRTTRLMASQEDIDSVQEGGDEIPF